jgi:hypothetical protein
VVGKRADQLDIHEQMQQYSKSGGVVESDRVQLREIVQRVRDGRRRTNSGNGASLEFIDRLIASISTSAVPSAPAA